MIIDATFWVAVSFFIFLGVLFYLKVPQKINDSLASKINEIKKELDEAEKLKVEAKNLLSSYEKKIDKSKKETQEIITTAKKDNEKNILEKTKKFHQMLEDRKKSNNVIKGNVTSNIGSNIGIKATPIVKKPIKESKYIKRKTLIMNYHTSR